ncbi:hypothetical protein B7486_72495, partial [cyanobacterium TDX16]
IVDLDPHADGVLSTPDGRWHLAYNGEVYNHVELRAELRGRHDFRTTSDGEVVLAAWAAWGPGCLDRFVGMFAFLLWDDERQELHAVRDRFGVKPLCAHRGSDGSHRWASEVGALAALGTELQPSATAWGTYLATGAHEGHFLGGVVGPRAGVRRVQELDGVGRSRRWYDPVRAVGSGLDDRPDADVAEEVAALMAEATALRFRSDVPVG